MSEFIGFLIFILVLLVGVILYWQFTQEHYCLDCGTKAHAKKTNSGSFIIECLVWLFAIIISLQTSLAVLILAFIYSLFRSSSSKKVCPNCQSTKLVEPMSTQAKEHQANQQANQQKPCPYCAEPIKLAAIVCKHCGKDLPQL